MASQTETEKQVAEFIKKHTIELVEEQHKSDYNNIYIQTFIRDNKQKVMVIKVPQSILPKAQRKYESIMKSMKQKFHDYFIILVQDFGFENKLSHFNTKKVYADASFPFAVNGIKVDVKSPEEEVVNLLVEKKCTYNENEFRMIETAINGLLGVNVVVGVNHHTLN